MPKGASAPLFKRGQRISGLTPSFTTTFMPLNLTTGSATVLGSAWVAERWAQKISGLTPSFTTTFMPLKLTTWPATILQRLRVST